MQDEILCLKVRHKQRERGIHFYLYVEEDRDWVCVCWLHMKLYSRPLPLHAACRTVCMCVCGSWSWWHCMWIESSHMFVRPRCVTLIRHLQIVVLHVDHPTCRKFLHRKWEECDNFSGCTHKLHASKPEGIVRFANAKGKSYTVTKRAHSFVPENIPQEIQTSLGTA